MKPVSALRLWPAWARLALAVVVVAAIGVAAYFTLIKSPGDTSNPNVQFLRHPPGAQNAFVWPTYGYDTARTRFLSPGPSPPFRQAWIYHGRSLLEFQPVLADGTLFFLTNNGEAIALSAQTGEIRWRQRVGDLNASAPTWQAGKLYVTTLSNAALALDARTGQILWTHPLPSPSESSPLVVGDRVYLGSQDGTVYALNTADGSQIWTYKAEGSVKAAPAYADGLLYFGDYAGVVTCLRANDGSRVWSTSTSGRTFSRSGNFYSTPALAYGRVYIGNTDHRVYSFSAADGQLAWSKSTGNYVYAAPAVGEAPGVPPTVYIGSYDGSLYALDARSGETRWQHTDPGGRISGAATVVAGIVYYSDLASKSTTGLDIKTGQPVFNINFGAFNPVISDGARLYLTGFAEEVALEPQPPSSPPPQAPQASR